MARFPKSPLTKEKIEAASFKEPNSGCWLWERGIVPDGYGMTYDTGHKYILAHRAAWSLWRGPIPAGLHVLHKCDTPPCVNPEHLFLGSHADNMADRDRKRRQCFGDRSGGAKLSNADVLAIYNDPRPNTAIAAAYGMSQNSISQIKTGATWRGVTNAKRVRGLGHTAKLTAASVLAIRADARSLKEVADDYSVTDSTISLIRAGKIWKTVAPINSIPNAVEG